MDSDRATNNGTCNAIRIEWIDEHVVQACKREPAPNVGTFRELEVKRTLMLPRSGEIESKVLAFVRLRSLRSFVVNSVIFATSKI